MITLKTLAQASKENVIKQVGIHLLTQRKHSKQFSRTGTYCAYRGEGGLMCAAGCLIGDGEYNRRAMENISWGLLVNQKVVPSAHHYLIQELQDIHDDMSVSLWPKKLKELCSKYRVDSNWIDEIVSKVESETGMGFGLCIPSEKESK